MPMKVGFFRLFTAGRTSQSGPRSVAPGGYFSKSSHAIADGPQAPAAPPAPLAPPAPPPTLTLPPVPASPDAVPAPSPLPAAAFVPAVGLPPDALLEAPAGSPPPGGAGLSLQAASAQPSSSQPIRKPGPGSGTTHAVIAARCPALCQFVPCVGLGLVSGGNIRRIVGGL